MSLSSTCGLAEGNIKIGAIDSSLDSRKSAVQFDIMGDSAIDSWAMITRLRHSVSDKSSPLNTIGNMKRVFNGAVLRVFDPSHDATKAQNPRYRSTAPVDINAPPGPPVSAPTTPHRRRHASKKPQSPNHSIPVDGSHNPFNVLVIPPGARSPPESPSRDFHLHLPSPTRQREEPIPKLELMDVKPIDAFLRKPVPCIPASLLLAHSQLKLDLGM